MNGITKGAWCLPEADDEFPHELSGTSVDLPWKDTYCFAFRDDHMDVSGTVHLTLSPNRGPGLRAAVALRRGGRQLSQVVYEKPWRAENAFGCEIAELTILDGHWDARKHLRLAVSVEGVTGVIEIHGRHYGPNLALLCPGLLPESAAIQLSGHAEQGITVSGRLDWAGDIIELDGHGHRDRSWGYRKSDGMNPMGYTYGGIRLPQSTIGFLGWQHPDASSHDALPVGGWLADDEGVQPLTSAWYRRAADGRPAGCGFTATDGTSIELETIAPTAEVFYAYHDPEFDGPAIGTLSFDQHVSMSSNLGPAAGIFNHGVPFLADVFRNARFCAADESVARNV